MNELLIYATEIIFSVAFLFWLYKCVVVVEEGWNTNIKTWGRFSFTISGDLNRVYDPTSRKLVPGVNTRKFYFIFWGPQLPSRYKFLWAEGRDSTTISEGDSSVIWGDIKKDVEVTYQRNEWTSRHKNQGDYRFRINALETGEMRENDKDSVAKEGKSPENIKIDSSLIATVKMISPYEAEFTSGANWYSNLQAYITGTLSEVISMRTYAQLPEIRGEKISEQMVKNSEPDVLPTAIVGQPAPEFVFKDANGKRAECVTFIQRINYEMQTVKHQGVELINITLLDYDANAESKPYLDALQKNAVSVVSLQTASNNAQALGKILEVKKINIIAILNANKDATKQIMETENVTTVKKAQAQPNLRVIVEGSNTTPQNTAFNVNEMVQTMMGMELLDEIKGSDSDDENKKTNPKKGGNK